MRNRATMALMLAACAAGCGERSDPSSAASEPAVVAPSESAAASAQTQQTSDPSHSGAPPASGSAPIAAAPAPAAAAPTPASPIPARLRALGTEPFWNATVEGGALTYTTPEDQNGRRTTVARRDRPTGAEFVGKLGSTAIHLEVTRRSCSDGMSDRRYPFTAVLTFGDDRRQGCAS